MLSDRARLEDVRRLVREGRYRSTLHAEHERDQDRILVREIEEALCLPRTEIVEDYPADPRGASFLMLGFSGGGLPTHAVCTITDVLLIITLYRPDPGRWIQWRERREG